MAEVVEVVLQAAEHLLHGVGVAVVKGGVGGYTGANLIEILISLVVLQNLVNVELALRARTHECHISLEHIPQLWQLIQMVSSQFFTNLRQSRISLSTSVTKLRTHSLSIQSHRTELVDVKWTTKATYALLLEYCRTAIFGSHENVGDDEYWP